MSGTDYKANMQSIAQQMNIHQVISNPMALLGGMAYARMQENDIELMRCVLGSSCVSELFIWVRDMHGSAADYQQQKKLLQEKAFLNDYAAHRVLVGLWALVGKDADNAVSGSSSSSSAVQTAAAAVAAAAAQRAAQLDRSSSAVQTAAATQKAAEQGRASSAVQAAAAAQKATGQDRVWGHSMIYYIMLVAAEFHGFMVLSGFACVLHFLGVEELGMQMIYDGRFVVEIIGVCILMALMRVFDRKDAYHLGRSKTMLFNVKSVLPKGEAAWGMYTVKLILWVAVLGLTWHFSIIEGGYSTLHQAFVMMASCADAVFDAKVHQYLSRVKAAPDAVK